MGRSQPTLGLIHGHRLSDLTLFENLPLHKILKIGWLLGQFYLRVLGLLGMSLNFDSIGGMIVKSVEDSFIGRRSKIFLNFFVFVRSDPTTVHY